MITKKVKEYLLLCNGTGNHIRRRDIEVIVHTILGLPGESRAQILQTMDWNLAAEIPGRENIKDKGGP